MIEKYFALKYFMTIAPIIFVLILISFLIIEGIVECYRQNRNEKILKKYNCIKDLDCYNQWCYYINGTKIRESALYTYKIKDIKKMINKEKKKGSQ